MLYVDGKESMITLDYTVDPSKASDDFTEEGEEPAAKKRKSSESTDVRLELNMYRVHPSLQITTVSCAVQNCYLYSIHCLQRSDLTLLAICRRSPFVSFCDCIIPYKKVISAP